MTRAQPATRFTPGPSATRPPAVRDGVRLMVAGDDIAHRWFRDLPDALEPGDLLVVNTSDTEPAAVPGRRSDGRPVLLHVAGPGRDGGLVVELRTPDGGRVTDVVAGEAVALPAGAVAVLHSPVPGATPGRMWRAAVPVEGGLRAYLGAVGAPVRYSYVPRAWPLTEYRTVFATPVPGEFGSAEMPSAGRPFTRTVLDALRSRGVRTAEIVLHTGLSSPEAHEVPLPERYRVPAATADAVGRTHAAGGRVVAVGTTATRALESATGPDGTVSAAGGWTDLVLGPDRPARVVDGLVTGWHEPEASHLLLLEAVAGPELVGRAYAASAERPYRWHEFGDSCLLLPPRSVTRRAR
ncbi:S-adenosylmethionine:tRNA ribosyltransferase-isomerase [Pseudonocardia sp. KRD-184]|uniref:S-adenosylmethionine:tRNA ribosyltransferase-isomerase n=2 Tax=Pseudonocardia oceani TaxID=2792013 RepID=A0ABS6UCB4_9PSEU|nr:S-adenosylmethionine:tRNA ribosyltransferase-isomerase [Pseudonocardia oceani]MBW0095152.1 S-adenosylmethionine:tRNA ribosyltransferase-isomerase [Pseudonocardia oceani]MBW0107558.1 S-adenosylmethionine:tRNA ribosyltransferase-isomerase [Pseudonocardia oceani]MBW0120607.1 S-adenosylmethionine:tRNA ribosyltransferase-isomerase [Pseudonocardia oceani]MBW0129876.1 S-adenosylmethionine:tRNA ribosyltransferase-isomerase [Pseudonocardia oceani]